MDPQREAACDPPHVEAWKPLEPTLSAKEANEEEHISTTSVRLFGDMRTLTSSVYWLPVLGDEG
jgi:hypothetical protein